MQEILSLIEIYNEYIIIGLVGVVMLLLLLLMINMVRTSKLKKRYEKFMSKENVDLESLLVNYAGKVDQTLSLQQDIEQKINQLDTTIKKCSQKVGIIRYNALEGAGAELSFAVAVLDDYNNGVVINGIYSRDGSYTYAKEIKDGKSAHHLSEEEEQAIQKAIGTN